MKLEKTIDNKRQFEKPNGDMIIDLTQQNYRPGDFVKIIDYLTVSKDFAMRPDLIAVAAYRDINAADMVMKQNDISNPFSIDEGDIIFLQERREINEQFVDVGRISDKNRVRTQYLDANKAPEIDENLQKFNSRQKPKQPTRKSVALPPNFANFGDKEIKFRGGKVIFGEDITENKEVCQTETLSKSELLKRLSKNRMIRPENTNSIEREINPARTSTNNPNQSFRSGGTQGGR